MNKKIGFVFLVLLCSLSVGVFAVKAQCVEYSNKNRSLEVSVVKNGNTTYEVTIGSYANVDLYIVSFSISKDEFKFDSPNRKVIKRGGEAKVLVTYTGRKKSHSLDASDITVYAQECH